MECCSNVLTISHTTYSRNYCIHTYMIFQGIRFLPDYVRLTLYPLCAFSSLYGKQGLNQSLG